MLRKCKSTIIEMLFIHFSIQIICYKMCNIIAHPVVDILTIKCQLLYTSCYFHNLRPFNSSLTRTEELVTYTGVGNLKQKLGRATTLSPSENPVKVSHPLPHSHAFIYKYTEVP